jgi:hypothetical protein
MSTYVNHGFIPLRQASNSCHPPQTLADRCAALTWAFNEQILQYSLRNVFVGTQDLRVFEGILVRISDKLRCSTQSLGRFFQCPCGHIKFHHRGTRHPPWYRANFGNRSPKAADVWQKPRRFDLDCLSTASWLVMGSIRWPFGLLIEKHDKQIADESQTWVWNSKKCLWI